MLDALTISLPTALKIAVGHGRVTMYRKADAYFVELHTQQAVYTGVDKTLLSAICSAYNQYAKESL